MLKQNLSSRLDRLNTMVCHLTFIQNEPDKYEEINIEAVQDSVVMKFELCFELFMKVLKDDKSKILNEKESELLQEMTNIRNACNHYYNKASAKEYCNKIIAYQTFMRDVLAKI